MKLFAYVLLVGTQLVSATMTGIAVSVHDKVIQNSKAAAISYFTTLFSEVELEPFDIPGGTTVSNIRISNIQLYPDDFHVAIEHDKITVDCNHFGLDMSGHSS